MQFYSFSFAPSGSKCFKVDPQAALFSVHQQLLRIDFERPMGQHPRVDCYVKVPHDLVGGGFKLEKSEPHAETDPRSVAEWYQHASVFKSFDSSMVGIESLGNELIGIMKII